MAIERVDNSDFWKSLEKYQADKKGWRRIVAEVREYQQTREIEGDIVAPLADRTLEKAKAMLASDVEYRLAKEALERLESKLCTAVDEFWLEVRDQEGLAASDELSIDLKELCVRREKAADASTSKTFEESLDSWAGLVKEAMQNPLAAVRMAQDPVLPKWLQYFAEAMGNTYGDDPEILLAPNVRQLVEAWLVQPAEARKFAEAATDSSGAPKFLVQVARVLGLRRRFRLPGQAKSGRGN